jgi:hypothetical protein
MNRTVSYELRVAGLDPAGSARVRSPSEYISSGATATIAPCRASALRFGLAGAFLGIVGSTAVRKLQPRVVGMRLDAGQVENQLKL